ncbi:hypothetical protein, partial [Amnibacterium endophyticum]
MRAGGRARRLAAAMPQAVRRIEPVAPDWLLAVVRPKPAPPPWSAMIRYAATIGGALLAGVLAGQVAIGALLATGALTGAFGDRGGPLGERLRRIAAGCGAGLVGLALSRLLLEPGPGSVALVALAGAVSAYGSAIGAVASFASLQLIVMIAVGAGLGAQVPLPLLLGAFALGGAWAAVLSCAFAVARPEAGGPRPAVAAVFDRLADYTAAIADRRDLTAPRATPGGALAEAWDAVTAARAVSPGRRDDLHRLAATLTPATELARAGAGGRGAGGGVADRPR